MGYERGKMLLRIDPDDHATASTGGDVATAVDTAVGLLEQRK
jgi:hypothetical protein